MTQLLLDTHVLIWLLEDAKRISESKFAQIQEAADQNALYVSAITPWEIALLVSKNRLHLDEDVQLWIDKALALPGIRLYPLTPAIAVASTRLPWEMHPDPADRILAATVLHLKATIITADEHLLRYSTAGHLNCLPRFLTRFPQQNGALSDRRRRRILPSRFSYARLK